MATTMPEEGGTAATRVSVIRGTADAPRAGTRHTPAPPKWRPAEYSRVWSLIFAAGDFTMFLLSATVAISLVQHTHTLAASAYVLTHTSVIFILMWALIFERLGLYRSSFALTARDEFYYTAAALCIGIVPQLVLYTAVPTMSTSRLIIVLSALICIPTVSVMRYGLHSMRATIARVIPERIAVVGTRANIESVLNSLAVDDHVPVFCIETTNAAAELAGIQTHGLFDIRRIDWLRKAIAWGCRHLVIADVLPPETLPPLMATALRHDFTVAFALPGVVSHAYSLSLRTQGHQALLLPAPLPACRPFASVCKRIGDVLIASIALIFALPIILLCAIAIRLESPGPVLYRQSRVGRGGKTFEMLKLRSMRANAEEHTGPVWIRAQDDRVTRVGRILRATSLDELPQLLNVIRGDMSLVGPRPERPSFAEEFRAHLPRYDERHLVRPGITGCAQVHMRRQLDENDIGEKLSYDLFYVENWSLFMDVSLLFKTGFEVLFHRAR